MNRLKVLLLTSCPRLGGEIFAQLAMRSAELKELDPRIPELPFFKADLLMVDLDVWNGSDAERAEFLGRLPPRLPWLACSSSSEPRLVVEAMKFGAVDFIPKSELAGLGKVVEVALSQKITLGLPSGRASRELDHSGGGLEEGEELVGQLRLVIDRMPIGCILNDAEFRFTYWNAAAERIFGYSLREVKGRHPFGTITPPEAEESVGRIFRRLREGDMTANGVGSNQTKDGRRIICEWSNTPLRSADGRFLGILSMCQDVTARSQAEEAVQESEARFRQLAENIQECFWLSSVSKTEFIYVSPAFDTIWGFPRERLFEQATAWMEAVHLDDRARIQRAIEEKHIPGTFHEEYRITRPDGTVRWVRERAFPIRNAEGVIYRMAGLAEDVTRQKELERQFLQAQKMESVGRLAGGVAHDFGNMLTAISSFARLALDGVPPDSLARSDLEQVLKAAERATCVTKQLLTFARRQVFQPSVVDLNSLLSNLEKMLSRLVRENIRLSIRPGPDLWKVYADASQIEQALINLVVNAVDAMPTGGELLIETENLCATEPCRLSHIHVPPGEHVLLRVTDTGEGMSEQTQAQVFEPFFTTKAEGKGTGLGLATVYGIVQQTGGQIDVSSQKGRGTTFIVALKRAQAESSRIVEKG